MHADLEGFHPLSDLWIFQQEMLKVLKVVTGLTDLSSGVPTNQLSGQKALPDSIF